MVKTITVTNEAYERMKNMKHGDESFSDLFLRIAPKGNRVDEFFGTMSKEDHEETKKRIAHMKSLSNKKMEERLRHARS